MMFLLAIPAALLASVVPEIAIAGVLALLPTYLLRFTVAGIPSTVLEALLIGTLVGGIIYGVRKRIKIKFLGPLTFPLVATLVVWMISTIHSQDTRAGLGALKAWLVEPALLAVLMIAVVRTERSRWIVFWGLVLGSVAISAYGIVEKLFHFGLPPDGRLNSVFVPANYHAMLTGPVLALLFPLLRRSGGRWRLPVVVSAVVIGLALVLTESYGAFLGVSAAVLFWIATLPSRQRKIALVSLAVLAVLVVGSQSGTEKFRLLGKLNERSSSSVRVQIWHTALELTRQHLLVGVGPNAFEAPYRHEVPILYWPPLEWLVAQPHNLYLAVISETGTLGLLAFIWLLAAWFQSAVQPLRTLKDRPWTLAAALGLVVILVHGLVDTPIFKNDLSVLFAVVLAIPFLRVKSESLETRA